MENKKEVLRAKLKVQASLLTKEAIVQKSQSIARFVTESDAFCKADVLFIYLSTSKEPGTEAILQEAWRTGKKVLVPKCLKPGIMEAIPIASMEECITGSYGILEPVSPEEKIQEGRAIWQNTKTILAVIPCLSAGENGSRLGHGAGYYDRFLETHPCLRMILCFEELLSEEIPMNEWDQYMDVLVTEKRITDCQR